MKNITSKTFEQNFAMKIIFLVGLLVSESLAGSLLDTRTRNLTKPVSNFNQDPEPIVEIEQGTLEGGLDTSRSGRTFYSFKGIPYGKVLKRFDIGVPAEGWNGTRDAKEYALKCAQINSLTNGLEGEEDCLKLDVFVPKMETIAPVMVFIYGGGFQLGDTHTYRPHYLVDEDIIVVTISYRVGPLGFLNAGIKSAGGNQGLKDVVLALKWVQTNINAFGGDSSKVTIFGESAGSAAVSALIASPMAAGLFSGAISESGVALSPMMVFPHHQHKEAEKLAHALDCPTRNTENMVECLLSVNADELLLAAVSTDPTSFERERFPMVSPTIETFQESENDPNIFLSENVETLLREGRFNKVPFLVGFNSHEGLSIQAAAILLNASFMEKMNEEWGRVVPQSLFYLTAAKDPCVVSTKLKNTYFKGAPVSMDTADNLIKIYSEIIFEHPSRKLGLLHAEHAPVYFYNFTKHVRTSLVDLYGWPSPDPTSKVPVHADDVQYVFQAPLIYPPIEADSPEYEFSVNFVKVLTSFAKNARPTHVWGSKLTDPDQIQPVNPSDERHLWLTIDDELDLVAEPDDFVERMSIIEEIRSNDFFELEANM